MEAELPLARLRSTTVRGRLAATRGDLDRWIGTRAQWLLPRAVPFALAGLGLLAILSFTWALARTTVGVSHGRLERPTVVYLVRIRPPATGTTVLGAAMTSLVAPATVQRCAAPCGP